MFGLRLRSMAIAAAAILCACSGGASSGPTVFPPAASPSNAGPTASESYTLTGAAQSLALPLVSGCTGRVTLPFAANTASTTLSVTTSRAAPADLPSAGSRRPQAAGSLKFLCYITLQVSQPVTFPSLPGFSVTVAPSISTAAPQQFFYALSDPSATAIALSLRTEGPATVSGQTLTFDPAPDALSLLAHTNYIFTFYGTSTPTSTAGLLYVANSYGNSMSVFDTTRADAFVAKIGGGGISRPQGLALSANGKLYVVNDDDDVDPYNFSVSVLDTLHGNAALSRITGGGLDFPRAAALSPSGKLYVTNLILPATISVFDTAHGNAALPAITAPAGGQNYLGGVAVDASGRLYVTLLDKPSVSVFDTLHGNAPLPAITGGGLTSPRDLAIDGSGKLYVVNASNSVLVFDTAHGNVPLNPINPITGLQNPSFLAIDAGGKLYVAGDYSVSIFDTAHDNLQLPSITSGGLDYPAGLAVQH